MSKSRKLTKDPVVGPWKFAGILVRPDCQPGAMYERILQYMRADGMWVVCTETTTRTLESPDVETATQRAHRQALADIAQVAAQQLLTYVK